MKPILLDALREGVFEDTHLEEGHRAVEVLVVVIVVILRLRIAVRDGILTVGVNDSRRSVVVLLIVVPQRELGSRRRAGRRIRTCVSLYVLFRQSWGKLL